MTASFSLSRCVSGTFGDTFDLGTAESKPLFSLKLISAAHALTWWSPTIRIPSKSSLFHVAPIFTEQSACSGQKDSAGRKYGQDCNTSGCPESSKLHRKLLCAEFTDLLSTLQKQHVKPDRYSSVAIVTFVTYISAVRIALIMAPSGIFPHLTFPLWSLGLSISAPNIRTQKHLKVIKNP
ncbi:hypothetical protein B0H19DRAFT_1277525 [Mycena capillaripes]|nr:hypothetical protein B0H19DRAFT_1277525 [Mycena capillaripes]